MGSLLTAAPALGCAVMMGGMMWLMTRGNKQSGPPAPDDKAEVADLRSEVERLRAEVRDRDRESDPTA